MTVVVGRSVGGLLRLGVERAADIVQEAAGNATAAVQVGGDSLAVAVGPQLWDADGAGPILRAALLLVFGLPLLYWLAITTRKLVAKRYNPQRGLIAGKILFYPGAIVLLITVMRELGFSLAPLLGAAGVLGIALGFASQTSVSNIISGFFLVGEAPFVVGDLIKVGSSVGRVLSVGVLSVNLRTWDNKLVRIPNETMIKSELTNFSRFPIRRVDLMLRIGYEDDLQAVAELLLGLARSHPLALREPEPRVYFSAFGPTAIHLKVTVWATRENRRTLKHALPLEVKRCFDEEGIRMPFLDRAALIEGAIPEWEGADATGPSSGV